LKSFKIWISYKTKKTERIRVKELENKNDPLEAK